MGYEHDRDLSEQERGVPASPQRIQSLRLRPTPTQEQRIAAANLSQLRFFASPASGSVAMEMPADGLARVYLNESLMILDIIKTPIPIEDTNIGSFNLSRDEVIKLVEAGVKNPVLNAFLGKDQARVSMLD